MILGSRLRDYSAYCTEIWICLHFQRKNYTIIEQAVKVLSRKLLTRLRYQITLRDNSDIFLKAATKQIVSKLKPYTDNVHRVNNLGFSVV